MLFRYVLCCIGGLLILFNIVLMVMNEYYVKINEEKQDYRGKRGRSRFGKWSKIIWKLKKC